MSTESPIDKLSKLHAASAMGQKGHTAGSYDDLEWAVESHRLFPALKEEVERLNYLLQREKTFVQYETERAEKTEAEVKRLREILDETAPWNQEGVYPGDWQYEDKWEWAREQLTKLRAALAKPEGEK